MAKRICMVLAVLVCWLCLPVSARTWTSKDGKTTDADFKAFSGTDNVILKSNKTGNVFEVPINSFSSADQEFLTKLRAEIMLRKEQEIAAKKAADAQRKKQEDKKTSAQAAAQRNGQVTALNPKGIEEVKDEKRGLEDEPNIVYLIGLGFLIIGVCVILLGSIMMFIEAYKCGIIWGVISLIPGVGWILFAMTNWQVSKKPLFIQMIGIAISIGGGFLAGKI